MERKWLLFIIAAVVFIGLAYFLNNPSHPEIAKAGSSDNVFGWAWSENIGWISFNSTNTGTAVDYGVSIDPSTGLFSGYAWAGGGEMNGSATATIGWISFNSDDLTGCPSPPCEARVDLTPEGTYCGGQYNVCGWARALSATSSPGDWDGWIKLNGISLNPDTKEFEGWAAGWDDSTSTAVIGWISFNCKNENWCATSSYKVKVKATFGPPPTVSNLSSTFPDPCLQSRIPTLSWTTTAVNPHAYQIQIATSSSFSSPIIDKKVSDVFGSENSWAPPCNYCCDTYDEISFGEKTYYWRVRVYDENGTSSWATSTFTTKKNCYPYSGFTISPLNPTVDVVVTFNNNSTCYSAGGCSSYFWDLGNGITSTTSGSPTTTYSSSGYKTVSLRVTDSNGYTCTTTRRFYVGSKLPWWKEIIPF